MELCEHGDLAQQLDVHQFFEEKQASFIIAELILSIEYIHKKNIVYRDLKPENILIDSDGHIRLADFGLAKQGGDNKQVIAQSFCGSPAYLAPEMLRKQGVTQSCDVYQIGIVLYEMLVGIPPYYNDDIKVLYSNISKGKLKIPKYLSRDAKGLLTRLMHKDPKKRPTYQQLKVEPFFNGINWEKLSTKSQAPPTVL